MNAWALVLGGAVLVVVAVVVVAAAAFVAGGSGWNARVFAHGRWSFRDDNTELHTLHHLGGGVFAVPSRTVRAGPPDAVG